MSGEPATERREALRVEGVTFGYTKANVLTDLSLHVLEREFVVLLGSNGAGKSTALRVIAGLAKPASGQVHVLGEQVLGWPAHRIGRGYIGLVPEGRRLFPDQSVESNLLLGGFHLRRNKNRVRLLLDSVYELFPKLADYRSRRADSLSGGEQQMVAIGRALMADPSVLMLDEPSLGLAPSVLEAVMDALRQLNQQGRSVLLVEQRVEEALRLADRAYVMERGAVVLEGRPEELLSSPELVNAYLGESLEHARS